MNVLIDVYMVGKSSKLEEKGNEGHRKLISIVNSLATALEILGIS